MAAGARLVPFNVARRLVLLKDLLEPTGSIYIAPSSCSIAAAQRVGHRADLQDPRSGSAVLARAVWPGMVDSMPAMDSKLPYAPIVEAVLDIDCDVPPTQELVALEASAREQLRDTYPKDDRQWLQEHRIEATPDASAPSFSSRLAVQAIRFHQEGGRQLVQLRAQGYSFNRLAPYGALDDYLAEIERTWRIYIGLAKPSTIRQIRLRYINRILLPMPGERVDLDHYLRLGPRLPDDDKLLLASFLNQYTAVEVATGLQINVTLTLQQQEDGKLPIIFDNSVLSTVPGEPGDWPWLLERINALRFLKNRVFKNTLTDACLALFQTP